MLRRVGGVPNLFFALTNSLYRLGLRQTIELIKSVISTATASSPVLDHKDEKLGDESFGWLEKQVRDGTSITKDIGRVPLARRAGSTLIKQQVSEAGQMAKLLLSAMRRFGPTDIIFLPNLEMGGSNKVARNLSASLLRENKSARVLLVTTNDLGGTMWGATQGNLKVVNFRNREFALANKDVLRLIYVLSTSIPSIRRLYCFNSEEFMSVLLRHWKLLGAQAKVYVALFCEDFDLFHRDISFGAKYYARLSGQIEAFISDNSGYESRLKERIANANQLSQVQTPWISLPQGWAGEMVEPNLAPRTGPIIWAGRFSEQKNWKTLIRIARKMPEESFVIFGEGPKRAYKRLSNGPRNIVLAGAFSQPSQVFEQNPSIFLHTSCWDGIPNVLIEFGALGLPIVSSQSGSILELLGSNNERALTVRKCRNASGYVRAIRLIRNLPDEAVLRAQELQVFLRTDHIDRTLDQIVRHRILEV